MQRPIDQQARRMARLRGKMDGLLDEGWSAADIYTALSQLTEVEMPVAATEEERQGALRVALNGLSKDDIEVDAGAWVSRSQDGDGVWVHAWVWVPAE